MSALLDRCVLDRQVLGGAQVQRERAADQSHDAKVASRWLHAAQISSSSA